MDVCRKQHGRLAEEHSTLFACRHGFTKQAMSKLVAALHQEKQAEGNDMAAAISNNACASASAG